MRSYRTELLTKVYRPPVIAPLSAVTSAMAAIAVLAALEDAPSDPALFLAAAVFAMLTITHSAASARHRMRR